MAPLPYNSTDIVFVDYTVGTQTHTTQVRIPGLVTPAAFGTWFKELLADTNTLWFSSSCTGVRVQVLGTNYSIPWPGTTLEGHNWGTGVSGANSTPLFGTFVGRGSTGRRCRLTIFGYKLDLSSYRVTAVENTAVADAVATLNAPTTYPIDIASTVVTWYAYLNVGYNAYYQRKVRT